VDTIHHYTSAESLALILHSRKIRLNRLDRVDDVRESRRHQGLELGKYFFVSYWTHAKEESIPQWHMYTENMSGVRLSLPKMPFKTNQLSLSNSFLGAQPGLYNSPLSLQEMLGKNYFVIPMFMKPGNFSGPVEYVDNVEDKYAEAIIVNSKGIIINEPFDLVRLKSKEWAFQREYRFFLFILPAPSGFPSGYEQITEYCLNALRSGISLDINNYDLPLTDEALDQLVVTTGPLCTPGVILAIEALVEKYAPRGRVLQSCFTGSIRRPLR
jgi:hypothetical protein